MTSTRWAPPNVGLVVVLVFLLGLIVAWGALLLGVLEATFLLWRYADMRTLPDVTLVVFSTVGLVGQALYMGRFIAG